MIIRITLIIIIIIVKSRWGLRVTPIMGAIAVFMIIFFMTDPPRGKADGSHLKPTSPVSDVRALGRNKSFVLSTIAFTCVTYCAGAMMWWGPNFAFAGFNKNSYSILSRLLSSSFS